MRLKFAHRQCLSLVWISIFFQIRFSRFVQWIFLVQSKLILLTCFLKHKNVALDKFELKTRDDSFRYDIWNQYIDRFDNIVSITILNIGRWIILNTSVIYGYFLNSNPLSVFLFVLSFALIGHVCTKFSTRYRSIMRIAGFACNDSAITCPYGYNSTQAFHRK